jgi:hypothetical protein
MARRTLFLSGAVLLLLLLISVDVLAIAENARKESTGKLN